MGKLLFWKLPQILLKTCPEANHKIPASRTYTRTIGSVAYIGQVFYTKGSN